MPHVRHHAIIVTSVDLTNINVETIGLAHQKAIEIFGIVSPVVGSSINRVQSFFVPPDGSGDNYPTSDEWDLKRDAFVSWLESQVTEDGNSYFTWVEVQYGDDWGENLIVRASGQDLTEPG
jgi:hypothetical protein